MENLVQRSKLINEKQLDNLVEKRENLNNESLTKISLGYAQKLDKAEIKFALIADQKYLSVYVSEVDLEESIILLNKEKEPAPV